MKYMKIAIIGLGNIGGSFALSIKANLPEAETYAVDIDAAAIQKAKEQNIIKDGSLDFKEVIPDADLIIFAVRSEEHTSELQSRFDLVCRLLLEKKKK